MREKSSIIPVKTKENLPSTLELGWEPLANLRNEVDALFEGFLTQWPFGLFDRPARIPSFDEPFGFGMRIPAVDVVERGKEFRLKAELPGMDEKDIDVELSDRMLTISGEKKEERVEGEEDGNYYHSERRYGSFKRLFTLPEGVDPDKVEASFKKGVLTVTLPKTPEAQKRTKKIKVKAK